ncbi:MAG: hypothetical protein V3U78_04565 [Thiotrichaceae bacterium]
MSEGVQEIACNPELSAPVVVATASPMVIEGSLWFEWIPHDIGLLAFLMSAVVGVSVLSDRLGISPYIKKLLLLWLKHALILKLIKRMRKKNKPTS